MKKTILSYLFLMLAMSMSAQVSSVQICDSVGWNENYEDVKTENYKLHTVPFDIIQDGTFVQIRGGIYFTDKNGNYLDIDLESYNSYYFDWDWATWGDSWAHWGKTKEAYHLSFKKVSEPARRIFDRGVYYVEWDTNNNSLYIIWLTELDFDEPANTDPVNPVDPSDPVDPNDPVTPVEPSEPVEPEKPKEPNVKTICLRGKIAEITDMSKAMDDKAFTIGDISNEKLREGVFVQVFGDYWFSDENEFPLYPSYKGQDSFKWATWGDGSLERYDGMAYFGILRREYSPVVTTQIYKFNAKPMAVYFKYDPENNILEEIPLCDQLVPVGDPTKPNLRGEIALITDLDKAMENCFTIGDISYEQLCEGVFVQVRGEYWLEDNDGLPLNTRKGEYEDYDWANWGDGSLAKYHRATDYSYKVEASNGKVTYGGGTKEAVYFKYDPAAKRLHEICLRDYLGKYDWHDLSLEGYARTVDGTDPITGWYDAKEGFKDDSLAYSYYNSSRMAEFGNVPLFFNENPYQVDGPCRLMYKGEPWPLKLVSVETVDEEEAKQLECEPGTGRRWTYTTDENGGGETINLQSGVYIFFFNYYDQEERPIDFTIMRTDLGRFAGENMAPAGAYEVVTEPAPVINAYKDATLTSYYTYEYREPKYRTKFYKSGTVGEWREKYYVIHTQYSSTTKSYPIQGLGAKLGYPYCVGIIYTGFTQSTYENRQNYATFSCNGKNYTVAASRGKGTPVVLFNPVTEELTVTYISDDQYNNIMTSVADIDADKMNSPVYDLNGRNVPKPTNGINIINGKKIFVK